MQQLPGVAGNWETTGLEAPSSPLWISLKHDMMFPFLFLVKIYNCHMKNHRSPWVYFLDFQKGYGDPPDAGPQLWHATNDSGTASEWLAAPCVAGRPGRAWLLQVSATRQDSTDWDYKVRQIQTRSEHSFQQLCLSFLADVHHSGGCAHLFQSPQVYCIELFTLHSFWCKKFAF